MKTTQNRVSSGVRVRFPPLVLLIIMCLVGSLALALLAQKNSAPRLQKVIALINI